MVKYRGHKVYMDGDYPAIYLGRNVHLHRLVWIENHGDIPKGCVIHHKDENKLNWDIENLEMLTRSEHLKCHGSTMNRRATKVTGRRETDGLTEIHHFHSVKGASEFTGAYMQNISRVINGKSKTANGWYFERGWTL